MFLQIQWFRIYLCYLKNQKRLGEGIRDEKPLFRAIRHYQLKAFEQLVRSSAENGVSIHNQIDAKGNTLLHAATKKNFVQIFPSIEIMYTNSDPRNDKNARPLMVASKHNSHRIALSICEYFIIMDNDARQDRKFL